MNQEETWLKFTNSGKIEDYLEYNKARLRQENLMDLIQTIKGIDFYGGIGLADEGADLHAGNGNSDRDGFEPDAYR